MVTLDDWFGFNTYFVWLLWACVVGLVHLLWFGHIDMTGASKYQTPGKNLRQALKCQNSL